MGNRTKLRTSRDDIPGPMIISLTRWIRMSPLKMFEYMASGRAILATDLPAIKTTLRHGKNAWLVEPDDKIALLAGLKHLLSNDDTCDSLGAQAKSDVKKHTWDQRASRIMGHFFSKGDGEFGKSVTA